MKTSVCLAVVIAVVYVIQMVNAQHDGRVLPICPSCRFLCLPRSADRPVDESKWCPPCECPVSPTCENFQCFEGEKCVLKQVICEWEPCYPQPTCVPINVMTTTTSPTTVITTPATIATPTCMEVMCMSGCGWVLGSDGCAICVCQTSCTAVTCPVGSECQMLVVSCFKAPCPESLAICVPSIG